MVAVVLRQGPLIGSASEVITIMPVTPAEPASTYTATSMDATKVLITGGAGFIGSTIASACADADMQPILVDNLSRGTRAFVRDFEFHEVDCGDRDAMSRILDAHPDLYAVIHCAALINVPESVAMPGEYYENNVAKLITLASLLRGRGTRFVFSSSASIYVPGSDFAVDENSSIGAGSPYARTKVVGEWLLGDLAEAGALKVVSLRYFNPIGADPQLRTGLADPAPTHAMGKLVEARAHGRPFTITGTDYPTRDGTGIRDYIHVWDLARAHVAALAHFDQVVDEPTGFRAINLGTGSGTTVRELVDAFREVVPDSLAPVEAPRRSGDAVGCFTRSDLAATLLGWEPQLTLADGISGSLAWAEIREERVVAGR